MNRPIINFSLLILLVLIACKSDTMNGRVDLEGKWELYSALRNNKTTGTLKNGFFSFKDTIMETNITGSLVSGRYEIDGNSIVHHSTMPATYKVNYLSNDTLHLNTEIQGFKFLFQLQKALDTIPQ